MLDHAAGIDEVVTPVFIAIAIGIAGGLQLGIGEQVIEIDLSCRDLIGIRIDLYKVFFATAAGQEHYQNDI